MSFMNCANEDECVTIFRQFFDIAPFPVSIAKVNGTDESLVYVNPAFTELTGYESVDILGLSCRILQAGDLIQEGRRVIRNAINARAVGQSEFINYRKDGSKFWNSVRVMPLNTNCTTTTYMLGFQVDMTAVVEPQLAFDHALKQKKLKVAHECHQERLMAIGTTVAATAHEINNPIDGVITNLEYIKKLEVSCEVRNVAEESLGELKRIIRLIKAMLVFSRQEVLDKQRRICSVRCVLDEVLLITTPIIKMSSVLFTESESSVDVNHYELDVDADEVKQVLFNLITNAVQSMTAVPVAQRKLLIDCHLLADKGQVLIRVTDTGVGVPADLKKKIFEPFFTTKSEGNGTGLGLAISMQLVQNVGGILALDNDYTQGARFLLYLPICARNR